MSAIRLSLDAGERASALRGRRVLDQRELLQAVAIR